LVKQWVFSQEASVATLCRASPHQRLNVFTIITSPRKFTECLYCDVSPPPILPVLSHFIESHLSYTVIQLYGHTKLYIHPYKLHSYIHTIIHSYINTFTYSYIHAYTTYTQRHSYMVALVTQSLVWLYPFSSVLTHHCAKQQVLQMNNWQLSYYHQKCHPKYVWSRDVTRQCQVASPNKQTACIYLYHMSSGKF